MEISINRIDGKVNSSPSILTFTVTVDDNFTLSKVIQVQEGDCIDYVDSTTEWSDTYPVMVSNMINKYITFAENPTEFTAIEILDKKYNSLLDNTPFDFIQAGIFLNEDKINLDDIQANTGVAIMQLLPFGYAKSKVLTLKDTVNVFRLLEFDCEGVEITVNDIKFVDNQITLEQATNEIVIKFTNTTDKYIDVKSYAIAY